MRAADQSFLASGMPSFSAYPFLPDGHPDRRPWTGGSANAWWWHTEHDTLDKADVSILTQDVKVGLAAVWGLATGNTLPLDYRATVKELHDAIVGFKAVASGVDFEPLLADTRSLADALERFELARPNDTSASDAGEWNATVIRLGRILNPVIYTRGGRFHHDPAEWSPILRATKRFTLPGLTRIEGLPQLEGKPEQRFLETQALREINRTRTAVREALRELAQATLTG